jgi:hypothetical protein
MCVSSLSKYRDGGQLILVQSGRLRGLDGHRRCCFHRLGGLLGRFGFRGLGRLTRLGNLWGLCFLLCRLLRSRGLIGLGDRLSSRLGVLHRLRCFGRLSHRLRFLGEGDSRKLPFLQTAFGLGGLGSLGGGHCAGGLYPCLLTAGREKSST